jgi:lipopolysaccharide transport system permease protein
MTQRTASGAPAPGPSGVLPRSDGQWIENRPVAGWLPTADVRELWNYRDLALTLALRDLRVRYKQTFFGVAWAVIQPLVAALIFSVVFGRLAGLASDGMPYPVFVYAGLTIWLYFSGGLTSGAQSLVDNRELVSKVYFPRMLAPAGAVIPGLLDLAVSLAVLGVFLLVYEVVPSPALLLTPVWILAACVFAFAVGLWLSALNVKYRDVKHALGFGVQVWMFASPVVYSSSLIEGTWAYLYAANPMVSILDGFRWSVADGPAPGAPALVSLVVGVLVLLSGLVYFRNSERTFADLI